MWRYVGILLLIVGVGVGIGALYEGFRQPEAPAPVVVAAPIEPTHTFIEPLTLEDIRITVIRVGTDVTVLLDWDNTTSALPFHLWVSVEGSDVVLHSPNNVSRQIEVVPGEVLTLYGSTLYHELVDNRLAIDLQVNPNILK